MRDVTRVAAPHRDDVGALGVGGGPAEATAALYLGRAQKRTLGGDARSLVDAGIQLEPRRVVALHGRGRNLTSVELEGGEHLSCEALVIAPARRQADIVLALRVALDADGYVQTDDALQTSISGIYVCGDAAGARQQMVSAAADGAAAAMSIADGDNTGPVLTF